MNTLFRFSFVPMLLSFVLSMQNGALAQNTITHQISLSNGQSWCDDGMINGLFSQINSLRAQHGLPGLTMDSVGMKDAEIRATQFITYMSMNTPNTPGFNPHQGYDTTAASLGYSIISEDLAFVESDPAAIVLNIWQDPLHLAAMLAPDANIAGVSCVYSGGIPFWTYEPGCSANFCGQSAPVPTPTPTPTPTPAPPTSTSTPTLDSEEWTFLTLINNYRHQNNVGPLQVSAALEASSQWMSNDMATKNYVSHTDSLGRNPSTRFPAFGYPYAPWGENIAAGLANAQDAFNGWLNACDADASGNCTFAHRQNMLGAGFVVIGIARTYNPNSTYGWYWTTDFGGFVDQTISPPSGPSPTPAVNPPTIKSFVSSPTTITAGQSTLLSWTVVGASTISVDNGIGDVSTLTSKSVSPAQTTTYTLNATNAGGSSTASVTVTVNVPPTPDTQPPTAPTLISAIAKSQTEIDLTWRPSTDNVGVMGYQIIRNGSVLKSVPSAALSYSDSAVSANTTYFYAIKAYDAAGNFSTASNSAQVTTPAAPVPATMCPPPAMGTFTGCYFNNTNLTGQPVFVKTDSQVNFDWGSGSPDRSLSSSGFSVRWQGMFTFAQENYTFNVTTSDGMRLSIDGTVAWSSWQDQPPNSYQFSQSISQGNHLVTVEYYQHTGAGVAKLSWQGSAPSVQRPAIAFFTATPSVITAGQSTTLSWSVSGASSATIDSGVGDVTRTTSILVSPSQTTTYTLVVSNGSGIAVARTLVEVGASSDGQPPTTPSLVSVVAKSSSEVDLAWTASTDNVGVAGYQIIRNGSVLSSVSGTSLLYFDTTVSSGTQYTYSVKAFDAGGNHSMASNSLQVTTPSSGAVSPTTCPAPATGAFTGCYYNNLDLSGNPVFIRTDNQINFTWGTATPDSSVRGPDFSARWQGVFHFDQGNYVFLATISDGMRLSIDGVTWARWRDQAATQYGITETMSAGNHLITVEYYEHTGGATAILSWQKE